MMRACFVVWLALVSLAPGARAWTQEVRVPYRSSEVTVAGAGGTTLAGTVTVPDRPVAAVVFLPGSGPGGRDGSIGRHKPFAVAADYLARRGVASLRLDSRGAGTSAGVYYEATGQTFAADALAAVDLLSARDDLRDVPVGLVGHSMGSTVAMLAAASPRVAFVVLLSSPGRVDLENATERIGAQLRESGKPPAEVDAVIATLRRATANPDAATLRADLAVLLRVTAGDLVPPGQMDALVDQQVTTMRSPWARYFTAFDPRATLRSVRCPVLAITGSLDRVVPPAANLAAIHDALIEAGNRDATVLQMQGINHWLQAAKTGSPAEIASLPEAISPRVLALVAAWVRAHGRE